MNPGSTEAGKKVTLGGGYYNRHASPQAHMGRYGLSLLQRAASEVPLDRVMQLADFGASQGRNSLEPLKLAVEVLLGRGVEELEVTHLDQAGNDFNSLFQVLGGEDTYVRPHVYSCARAGCFYTRSFPRRHLHLGWTSIATHWLSQVPAGPPDHLWIPLAQPAARRLWAQQAARDWAAFTAARAEEFQNGGQLVVVGAGADDQGQAGAETLFGLAQEALKEVLPPGESAHRCLPTYPRARDEWLNTLDERWEVLEIERYQLPPLNSGPVGLLGFFRAAFHNALAPPADFYPALLKRLESAGDSAEPRWWVVVLRLLRLADG